MEMIENVDFRMVGSVAYFRLFYKPKYFNVGSEEQIAIDKVRYERRCLIMFTDDIFIRTGKRDSPF